VGRIRLVIDSNLSDLSLVTVATNRICTHLGLGETLAGEMELCVAEVGTNVIEHAYQGEPGHLLSVAISVEGDALRIEIADQGCPMSEKTVARLLHGKKEPDLEPIDKASIPEGGRGLEIIHALTDRIAYVREGDLNRLELTKCLSSRHS